MKQDLFTRVIDELAPDLWALTFYFQGEPYINPGFLDMVRIASDRGLYTATSTNAHFLTEAKAEETVRSGLSRLIISLDGTDQETYSAYRKEGELSKVIEGAERHVNFIAHSLHIQNQTIRVSLPNLSTYPSDHPRQAPTGSSFRQ